MLMQVLLGGKNRDFFGADKSCSAAVKEGFRANTALDPQHNRTRTVLNLVIQLQVSMLQEHTYCILIDLQAYSACRQLLCRLFLQLFRSMSL
jgi:hypothetical protein